MSRGYALIGLAAAVLAGCSSAALRSEADAQRVSPSAEAHLRAVAGAPSASGDEPSGVGAEVGSLPQHRRQELQIDDLAFLGLPIDAALWDRAQAEGYRLPRRLSERQGRTILLARSPRLRSAWRRRQAVAQRYGQVAWLRQLVDQYEGFARDPGARPPDYPLQTTEGLYGRLIGKDVELARVEFEIATLVLMQDFATAFHGALYQARAQRVLGENVDVSQRFLESVRTRYESGQARESDMLRAEMRLAEMREQRRSAGEARRSMEAQLASLLDATQRISARTPLALPRVPALATTRAAAANGPDHLAATLRHERAEAMLQLAERRILPDLSPGLSERLGAPGRDRFPAAYAAGGGSFVEELRDRTEAMAHASAQAGTAAVADAERAWSRMSDAVRTSRLYRGTLVRRANQALISAESEYRVGRTSYLNLDDVQRLWLRTSLAGHAADRDAHVAAARLRRVLGGGK